MYLRLENLTKSFGDRTVVKSLNASVEKGELVSLLGPSGCGKTTILNMIGGFVKPTSGRILLEGRDITGISPQKRPVCTVFQNYALFPHMSVEANVAYGLKFRKGHTRKQAREKARSMLEAVGLSGCEHMNAARLSGGQQQRVALARSLVLNPKLLLMDEPLCNLDAKLRVRMRREIKRIQSEFDITMFFVTHDQEEAMSISDRIMVMHQGVIGQAGTPEDIYRNPRTGFIADFVGRINLLEIRGENVYARPEDVRMAPGEAARANGGIPGTVRTRFFLGNRVTYMVDTAQGEVQVDVAEDGDDSAGTVGQSVVLTVARETVLGG